MKTYQHFIDGQYVDPIEGKWIDSIDPYRGEAWAQDPAGLGGRRRPRGEGGRPRRSRALVDDDAVGARQAAAASSPTSSRPMPTASPRSRSRQRQAAGRDARPGRLHPEWWRYFGGLADKIEGAVLPIDKPDIFAFTRHEPIGVVAA